MLGALYKILLYVSFEKNIFYTIGDVLLRKDRNIHKFVLHVDQG